MKIEMSKREHKTQRYSSIEIGDVFEARGKLWMKIPVTPYGRNAVALTNGRLEEFGMDEKVIVRDAYVVVED